MNIKGTARTIIRVLLYVLLVFGVLPAGWKIYQKLSSVWENERFVREMVEGNKHKLPRMMQNGRVRWDSIEGSNNVVTYSYTFIHSRKADLDTEVMAQASTLDTLKKMSDDPRMADMILRGVDVRLSYFDMDGASCYTIDVTKENLIRYRWQQRH